MAQKQMENGQSILYVGGIGENNYTLIQEALNQANPGDTIFVFSGIYYEYIIITKAINLVGEDKNNTIIKGFRTGDVVTIASNGVNMTGFTIKDGFAIGSSGTVGGNGITLFHSRNSHVTGNIITTCRKAIYLIYSDYNRIDNNTIRNNYEGIILEKASNNTLEYNTISSNIDEGIYLWGACHYNTLRGNNITQNGNYGIYIDRSSHNYLSHNIISGSQFGIYLYALNISNYTLTEYNILTRNTLHDNYNALYIMKSNHNQIYLNTFINNIHHYNITKITESSNTWYSPSPIIYNFSGAMGGIFTSYLGNYWHDYQGDDSDDNGIGDTPYLVEGDTGDDVFPLLTHWEHYFTQINLHPLCSLEATPSKGYVPLTVTFTLNATDPDGVIVTWELDVNTDQNIEYSGTGNPPTYQGHTYTHKGNYTATLTVSDNNGATIHDTVALVILDYINEPPQAHFTFSPSQPTDLDIITFQDNSTDKDGIITSYLWDFGDNTTSDMQNPQHTYSDDGTYQVYFTVIDNQGAMDNYTQTINVTNVGPSASFTLLSSPLYRVDTPLMFQDNSSDLDGYLVNWTWNLGDGSWEYGTVVYHNYTIEGNYTVTLEIMDNDGAGANKSLIVTIIQGEEDKNNGVIPGFDMVILSGIFFLLALYKRQKKTRRKLTH